MKSHGRTPSCRKCKRTKVTFHTGKQVIKADCGTAQLHDLSSNGYAMDVPEKQKLKQ